MVKHLESNHINMVALGLDEDVYGANGDLDESEIDKRLIENIHDATGHQYCASGTMPVWQAASLIRSVWEYMDRKCMEQLCEFSRKSLPENEALPRRESIQDRTAADISREGRTIIGVSPTVNDKDPGPQFAYTIGNFQFGFPELLVIGTVRAGFLNDMSEMMIERNAKFNDGEIVDLGGKVPVKVIDANYKVRDLYTIQAGQWYGHENYPVQQIVIPDSEGRYPGDAECQEPFASFPVFHVEPVIALNR